MISTLTFRPDPGRFSAFSLVTERRAKLGPG